jgi:ubiquinone/menaquinone biosynthesis C-methylase UbiE
MNVETGWPIERTAPEAYEQYIVPAYMDEWANTLIEKVLAKPGDRVLDVACGTGIVARKIARLVGPSGDVAGLDADKNMLHFARQFAEREGLTFLKWHHSDATCIPSGASEYNAVLCQQGLQFFPDKAAALLEMFRVMAPGGRLAVSVWRSLDRCPLFSVMAHIIGRYLRDQSMAGAYASCSLSDREELRSLLANAGFQDIHVRVEVRMARYPSLHEFLTGFIGVFPFGGQIAAMEPENRQEILDEITKSLLKFTDDDGLASPLESHIATAVKE